MKCNWECPKCSNWGLRVRHSRGHGCDPGRKDEHLDFRCGRCHFEWESDCEDAVEARVAALGPPP